MESAYLVYFIAFDLLGLVRAVFDVRRENENTIAFHRRFGAIETYANEQDVHFFYTREHFEVYRDEYRTILEKTIF